MRKEATGKVMRVSSLDQRQSWEVRPSLWTPFHDYVTAYRHGPVLHRWEPFFAAYHTHFHRFRGREVTVGEVGVQSGGSVAVWLWYFEDKLLHIGVDRNPQCKQFQTSWATTVIGDQGSAACWEQFKKQFPKVDIFIDDGGR